MTEHVCSMNKKRDILIGLRQIEDKTRLKIMQI